MQIQRRQIKNVVVDRKGQSLIFLPVLGMLIANSAVILFVAMQSNKFIAQSNINQPSALAAIHEFQFSLLSNLMWGVNAVGVVGLLIWLRVTHRIFGPMVPIRKHIQNLKKGDFESRIHLRKKDHFHELAEDLNELAKSLKNPKGQSLVQVMISIGVMSILAVTMTSLHQLQTRENASLTEKLAALDLQKTATAALADGSVCAYMLNNPVQTFNSTLVASGTPQTINISTPLYASVTAGVPGPVVTAVGQTASAITRSLVVSSIQLTISSGSGTSYLGSFVINFDAARLTRAINPVSVSTKLTADIASPTAALVTACQGSGGGSFGFNGGGPGNGALCGLSHLRHNGFYDSGWTSAFGVPTVTPLVPCQGSNIGLDAAGNVINCPPGFTGRISVTKLPTTPNMGIVPDDREAIGFATCAE
jgi:Tfp pilus assembly protein PilX